MVPAALGVAIRACARGESSWPLFIFGGIGGGKTFGALCLCDRVAGTAHFIDFADLCSEHEDVKSRRLIWEGTHAETVVTPRLYWQQWRRYALAVIDDVGTREAVSDHQFETLKRAVDERYGLPLVVISNLDLDRLARVFDDRVASRLGAGTIVKVEGEDRRLERRGA